MSNLTQSSNKQLVFINNKQQAITTTVMVASHFKKRHDHVMRDVDVLIKRGLPNFGESNYLDKQQKSQPMYEMDRTGFTLLAFGFTGDKALEFKIKYIQAFDAMEAALMKQHDESIVKTYEAYMSGFDNLLQKRLDTMIKKYDQKIESLTHTVSCMKKSVDGFSLIGHRNDDWKEIAAGWKEINRFSTEFIKMIS